MNVQGKQAVVVGLGESGLAMAKWLAREGARVRVADSRALPPNADAFRSAVPSAELVTGPFQAGTFAGADFIAISPGVPVEQVSAVAGAALMPGARDAAAAAGALFGGLLAWFLARRLQARDAQSPRFQPVIRQRL